MSHEDLSGMESIAIASEIEQCHAPANDFKSLFAAIVTLIPTVP